MQLCHTDLRFRIVSRSIAGFKSSFLRLSSADERRCTVNTYPFEESRGIRNGCLLDAFYSICEQIGMRNT